MTMNETIFSIDDVKKAHRDAGGYFFESDTMRFFRSHIGRFYTGPGGHYFVTSEQYENRRTGERGRRLYSVRKFDPAQPRCIQTEGAFQGYATSRAANKAAQALAATPLALKEAQ